mmetsp:Transcript_66008/g.154455  ORF Transcript_66008/g.154455 Transcript_66008/m.154455 type:complete len:223 (+) Transcript_66008:3735-4403(+)
MIASAIVPGAALVLELCQQRSSFTLRSHVVPVQLPQVWMAATVSDAACRLRGAHRGTLHRNDGCATVEVAEIVSAVAGAILPEGEGAQHLPSCAGHEGLVDFEVRQIPVLSSHTGPRLQILSGGHVGPSRCKGSQVIQGKNLLRVRFHICLQRTVLHFAGHRVHTCGCLPISVDKLDVSRRLPGGLQAPGLAEGRATRGPEDRVLLGDADLVDSRTACRKLP